MSDIKQQIAEAEAKLARLKEKDRKLENGQKIVIGGAVLAEAKDNREFAMQLIGLLENRVTRKTDSDRLAPLLENLKRQINDNQQTQQQAINREVTPSRHDR